MINFDPSIGAIAPKGKVESLSFVETFFSPNKMATNHVSSKASGFEGDPSSTFQPEVTHQWNSAVAAMDRVNLLGAAWNAVFSIAQQVPETFKKLMNS
jgi:hypothetical protein